VEIVAEDDGMTTEKTERAPSMLEAGSRESQQAFVKAEKEWEELGQVVPPQVYVEGDMPRSWRLRRTSALVLTPSLTLTLTLIPTLNVTLSLSLSLIVLVILDFALVDKHLGALQ
jgi:ferric-dicitrate binding protein FerR (iron transport regulator)